MTIRSGFTLIELLVVVTIIILLVGMAMPMVNVAQRSARRTNAAATLNQVQAAMARFRRDQGVWPYRLNGGASVADPDLDDQTARTNDLAWRLWRPMRDSERSALQLALDEIASAQPAQRGFGVSATNLDVDTMYSAYATFSTRGGLAFTKAELEAAIPMLATKLNKGGDDRWVNLTTAQIAIQRAQGAVLAGNTAVTRFRTSTARVLPSSTTLRGYGDDYLGGTLPASLRAGDAIRDPWGQPLIHVCPTVPGGQTMVMNDISPTTALPGTVNDTVNIAFRFRPDLLGIDPTWRQPTTTLASDIRTHAAPAWVARPELWSAGDDGRCKAVRNDPANRDNIPAEGYLRGLR
jgi:prepilin-type N-terminal cleavage/methylation domain-containing protein